VFVIRSPYGVLLLGFVILEESTQHPFLESSEKRVLGRFLQE